jgi:23S rRNA (guanosine2251-2'-O)-methyltransferase
MNPLGIYYQICQCPKCGMRYPVAKENKFGSFCPQCRSRVNMISSHHVHLNESTLHQNYLNKIPIIEGLLDNVRSAWNVGSMLRTADGIGVRHMHFCGISPTPNNPKVLKTSLGSEFSVPWTYHPNGLEAAVRLREQGYKLWALEGDQRAVPLSDIQSIHDDSPVVLVVGNEIFGIDPDILNHCEKLVYIPMEGEKHSYNVAVAFGIAGYWLMSIFQGSKSAPMD